MTMHVRGEGLKFPDGTIQTTAAVGGTGDGTGGSGTYTKDETDILLNAKANVGVSYTKAEADTVIGEKADIGVSYTKAETEVRLTTKADVADTYTKTEVDTLLTTSVPTGMIMLWSGATESIPTGWSICDGVGGTPDLRDKFVVGAGSTYDVNATGGSANAVVVSHNHTGSTNTTGNHTHSYVHPGIKTDSYPGNGSYTTGNVPNTQNTGASGNHAHSFTTSTNGESGTGKNLPPYYALAYIMKTT